MHGDLTFETVLDVLEGDLPNRRADRFLYELANARLGLPRLGPDDPIPEITPRATSDVGAALNVVLLVAPYASYRFTYDAGMNAYSFQIERDAGTSKVPAIAICKGLVSHCRNRVKAAVPQSIKGEWRTPLWEQSLSRLHRPGHQPPAIHYVTADYAKSDLYGLTGDALRAFLAIKDYRWLEIDADDDAWCSAISTCGVTPRDILDDLPAIRKAVKDYREPTKERT